MNMFTAPPSGGEILLASSLPGDMTYVDLQGETWLFHRDGFIASEQTIDLDTKWGGLKGAFGASSFFVVKCSGQGKAIVATYGALRRVDLRAGQQYTVDSGHLVAWPESLPIEVHKVGGLKSLFLSGEGFVVTLTGPYVARFAAARSEITRLLSVQQGAGERCAVRAFGDLRGDP